MSCVRDSLTSYENNRRRVDGSLKSINHRNHQLFETINALQKSEVILTQFLKLKSKSEEQEFSLIHISWFIFLFIPSLNISENSELNRII